MPAAGDPRVMTPAQFVDKWKRVQLPERAASQEHFIDLCRMLGQPTPADHDATGAEYAFEKGVEVSGSASKGSKGERGFADVWWKGKFGWEYKRRDKYSTLDEAYQQLLKYREALESPPLLIVSDISRIEIHTNFTGTKKEVYTIALEEMGEPPALDLLRRVFTDPASFKPTITPEHITKEVAAQLGTIAEGLRSRGNDPHDTAHFLMKCMFCLFAEDVALLPGKLFKTLLERYHRRPAELPKRLDALFAAMRSGGDYGNDEIEYFNGGLFDDKPALELVEGEIGLLNIAAGQDWGSVEPHIFGTLFERSLDPSKRAQIGAHYTSRDDIMLVIEPVIVRPLRREWEQTKASVEEQLERRRSAKTPATKKKADEEIANLLDGFQARLASVRVLDPACGSGNFLYTAIQQLLQLEKEVITFAARRELGVGGLLPKVRPTQLRGIEINPYAAELAQVVIWIGYLQWMRDNGFNAPRNPILEPIATIENRDAILAWEDEQGKPIPVWREGAKCRGEATWPEADFIVGNPPFLGSKVFRQNGLADAYLQALFGAFDSPKTIDLVCYWFLIAARQLESHDLRIGLLATQGIRGGDNRTSLKKITERTKIFDAWSDREWFLDGAAVHVSIICVSVDLSEPCFLDGEPVPSIHDDLTSGVDAASCAHLVENKDIAFMGTTKGGAFDISTDVARNFFATPNPNGKSNADVIIPWINGGDVTKRRRGMMIVDFGVDTTISDASGYESVFEYIAQEVQPVRSTNRREIYAQRWWIHVEPRPDLREHVLCLPRFVVTTRVSKHRLFAWFEGPTQPDSATFAFARSDDYFFGVLHSSIHELWARRQGTQLREAESGFRYTPTTCFETFPLPWPPGQEPAEGSKHRPLHDAIAAAAKALNDQRERWLNPPEWIAEVASKIDARDDFADVARVSGEEARRLIRQSAIDAAAAQHPKLKKRTLTNLYNERPTWLRLAHKALDEAVLAAYAATDPSGGWEPAWARVWEETGAGQPLAEGHALAEERAETEQRVLGSLLRLNHERAGG
ncbi:MAG: class I SAM-dependent DNA methyltransferase [Phycisphaeraceae bacterium]|nr:class I SAM-dependent DNA methyltransferase [Phycisphaeraceae bacterium]